MTSNWTASALRTWHGDDVNRSLQMIHAALGLAGETGELVDMLKKHLYKPGNFTSRAAVADELGDVFYYVLILAHLWGLTLDEVADLLFDKLADGHGWPGSGDKIKNMIAHGDPRPAQDTETSS